MKQHSVIIQQLQIGEFKVDTPIGLSELLESTWSKPKKDDEVNEFTTNYNRIVFRNEEGRLVTRYTLKGGETNENQRSRMEAANS